MRPTVLVFVSFALPVSIAQSEPAVDCDRLKSSKEPYQLARVVRTDGGIDSDFLSVFREPSGRSVAVGTSADGRPKGKNINQGVFVIEQAGRKVEYSGVDPKNFPLDRPATFTSTQTFPNGQTVSFKVEYAFLGKKTITLEKCRLDVVQYSMRRFNLADGQETSFFEGEYSPELQYTPNQRMRAMAPGKQVSITIASHMVKVGTVNFVSVGGEKPPQTAAQAPQSKGQSAQPSSPFQRRAPSTEPTPQEFSVKSIWEYRQQAQLVPGRVFAHGQADIVDQSGVQIGGVGFYCAVPHAYIDISVRKPGGAIGDYLWGNATLKTSLKLSGASMPASVERGIVFLDINDAVRPVLDKAFELKSGARTQRVAFDVANFAKFALIITRTESPAPRPGAEAVSYARMVSLCDTTIAAQQRASQ
jgi:hypothetical protein